MSVCEQFITSAPTNIMRKIKSLAFHEEFSVAEDEDASHGAVVEGVFLCADTCCGEPYLCDPASQETPFSNVPKRDREVNTFQVLAVFKCIVLHSLQRRW